MIRVTISNAANQSHVSPDMMHKEEPITSVILLVIMPEYTHEETIDKAKLKTILQNN